MIDDCGFFGDADRVLGRHDIPESPQMQVLHLAGPMGVQDAGVRADLVTFGMQVMLDGRHAPDTHLVCSLNDLRPFVDDLVIQVGIPAYRSLGAPVMLILGGEDGVKLYDNLWFAHDVPPWRPLLRVSCRLRLHGSGFLASP